MQSSSCGAADFHFSFLKIKIQRSMNNAGKWKYFLLLCTYISINMYKPYILRQPVLAPFEPFSVLVMGNVSYFLIMWCRAMFLRLLPDGPLKGPLFWIDLSFWWIFINFPKIQFFRDRRITFGSTIFDQIWSNNHTLTVRFFKQKMCHHFKRIRLIAISQGKRCNHVTRQYP